MTIEWPNWRIRSYEYGFMLERRTGPKYWKPIEYHDTLAKAAQSLIDKRIRVETSECIINAMDEASRHVNSLQLVKKIDEIAKEVSDAFAR